MREPPKASSPSSSLSSMPCTLPSALNTDAQWAQLIRWLQAQSLRAHFRQNGDIYLVRKGHEHE